MLCTRVAARRTKTPEELLYLFVCSTTPVTSSVEDSEPGAAKDLSEVSNEVMTMMKSVDEATDNIIKQFSVFQGDKTGFTKDESSLSAIRNAMSSSTMAGGYKIAYLAAKGTDHTIAQFYNVMRKIYRKLGYNNYYTSEASRLIHDDTMNIPEAFKDEVSTPDATIPVPRFSYGSSNEARIAQEFKDALKNNVLAADRGCRNKEGQLSLTKIAQGDMMRSIVSQAGYSQLFIRDSFDRLNIKDQSLRKLLDLYAKSWTNFSPSW